MNDVATGALADVPSGTWQIDPAHSVIGFSVRHLMSRVRGTFDEFTGHITVADGKLTIRDTTHDVRIDMDFLGYDPTGLQGEPRVGFEGHTSINRSDFGITFGLVDSGKVVVSDKVDISVEVEAFLTDSKGEN